MLTLYSRLKAEQYSRLKAEQSKLLSNPLISSPNTNPVPPNNKKDQPSSVAPKLPSNDEKVTSQPEVSPKTIYIVATGGTIAGAAKSATSSNYEAGKLNIKDLTAAIPDLKQFESIKTLDLFHIDSSDITQEHWLLLAKSVNELLMLSDVKSVVITHGTDTLEETAYFLNLVIKSKKPVVMVGSMRAATSLSADGPLNLFNALAVANSPNSVGKGVLVVMNDTIFDARDVTKTNATQVNTFSSPNSGPIGHVNYGKVEFEKEVVRKHTVDTPFNVSALKKLPTVEIILDYSASSGRLFRQAIEASDKPQGIVFAGTGSGNITKNNKALLASARKAGIQIVRSSRTGSGRVPDNNVDNLDEEMGLISADNLNPQKARILEMLSLTITQDSTEIQKHFRSF